MYLLSLFLLTVFITASVQGLPKQKRKVCNVCCCCIFLCLLLILTLSNKIQKGGCSHKPEKYNRIRTQYKKRPDTINKKTYVSAILGDRLQGKKLDIDPYDTMGKKGRSAMDAMQLGEVNAEQRLYNEQSQRINVQF